MHLQISNRTFDDTMNLENDPIFAFIPPHPCSDSIHEHDLNKDSFVIVNKDLIRSVV